MINSWGQILNWCKLRISLINVAMLFFTGNFLHKFQNIILHASCPFLLSHRTVRYDDNGCGINRQRQISKGIILKEPDGNNHIYFFPSVTNMLCSRAVLFRSKWTLPKPHVSFSCMFQLLRETSVGTIIQSPSLILLIYHPENAVT